MPRIGIGLGLGQRSGGGLNPATQAFLTATGITNPTEISAINRLVNDLQGYGLWSKMKALYPFVTDNTNLLGYTENFADAYWSKNGATVTANDTTAPNGTLTADKVVFSGANNFIQGTYNATFSLGNCYHSIWVKGTNGETININDGYVPAVTLTLNGSWQQVQFYSNRGGAQSQGIWIETYSGATARTIWLWGAQVSVGSSPVTYQPIATTQQAFISNQFKYNLKNPVDSDAAFRLVFNGGWTFASTGATPNGTNANADTKLVPNVSLSNSSAHASFYLRTALTTLATGYGVVKADYSERMDIINFGGTLYSAIGGSGQNSTSTTPYQSLILGSRTSATSNKLYTIGVLRDTKTATNTANLPNSNYYLGAVNNSGGFYTSQECAFASIGDGLTDTEASNFYTSVQTFQTTLGRQV